MSEGVALLGIAMLIGGFVLFGIGTMIENRLGGVMMWCGAAICFTPILAFVLLLAVAGIELIATS